MLPILLYNQANTEGKLLKKKKGFSYIEVVFALVISATIFTAILPLIMNSISKNRDTRLRLIAYEAASNEIEKLRESKISSLVAPSHTAFVVDGIPGSVGDVFVEKNLGDQRIASVKVNITWTDKGKQKNVDLNTYLYGSTE